MRRRARAVAGAAALLVLAAAPARANGCALELILAVDVSGSVDPGEYRLQTGGLASAFRSNALIEAILGLDGGLLVTVTQWSGTSRQSQVAPWTMLSAADGIAAFADTVDRIPRAYRHYSTAIGEALRHAGEMSADAPARCRRRVIDVSGDGVSNEGSEPTAIRDRLGAAGYTVNGLVIRGADPDPAPFYRRNVIIGDDSFVEIAEGFEDYPRAILRKLLREVGAPAAVAAR